MSNTPTSPAPSSGPRSTSPPPLSSGNSATKGATGLAENQSAVQSCPQWRAALAYLSRRIKKQSFATWLTPTRAITRTLSSGEKIMEVFVSNQFVAEWVRENYLALIEEALRETSSDNFGVVFSVRENSAMARQTEISFGDQSAMVANSDFSQLDPTLANSTLSLESAPEPSVVQQSDLSGTQNGLAHNNGSNPFPEPPTSYTLTSGVTGVPGIASVSPPRLSDRYRFKALVVSAFNEFAFAASHAVAERPGATKYNPLFIYGGVGLGKTHLAQSIGQAALEKFPGLKVKYATSEEFTNDFIYSLSNSTTGVFANTYRSVDILLIDDIQFFSGKESTQEQFFHTFNALYNSGKQIVLTADRPPQEIKGLESRLLSRFSSGLVADIQSPDLEARVAILRKKMSEYNFLVDEESLLYVASRITSNVRELEGALTRLYARASVSGVTHADLAFTEKALSDILNARTKRATVTSIQKAVAKAFEVDVEAIKGKKRTAHLALARQAAMYLTRSLTDHSLQRIGQDFGGRDHSTVIHACSLIEAKIESNMEFKQQLDDITDDCL